MKISTQSRNRTLATGMALLLLCSGMTGCGDQRVKTVPVEGRITYGGGNWPATGLVTFAPKQAAEGYPRRAGQAIFKEDGNFTVTTFEAGDGLIPGTYSVNIRCVSTSTADISKGEDHVPESYRRGETSGFEVVVPADDSKTIRVEFDVPQA